MEEIIRLDGSFLEEMAELYRKAFAGDPWNDDWSDHGQLLAYMRDISGAYNALNYGLIKDGRLIAVSAGSIRHWWQGTNYNIDELFVDPEYQGQGIGSRFLQMIEEDVKKEGAAGIFLQTDNDKPSYRFYVRNGYSELNSHVSFFKKI